MKAAFYGLFAKQNNDKVKPTSNIEPRILQNPQFVSGRIDSNPVDLPSKSLQEYKHFVSGGLDSDAVDVVDFQSNLHGREIYSPNDNEDVIEPLQPNGTFLQFPQSPPPHGDEKKQIETFLDDTDDEFEKFRMSNEEEIKNVSQEVLSKYGIKSEEILEETRVEENVREIKLKFGAQYYFVLMILFRSFLIGR